MLARSTVGTRGLQVLTYRGGRLVAATVHDASRPLTLGRGNGEDSADPEALNGRKRFVLVRPSKRGALLRFDDRMDGLVHRGEAMIRLSSLRLRSPPRRDGVWEERLLADDAAWVQIGDVRIGLSWVPVTATSLARRAAARAGAAVRVALIASFVLAVTVAGAATLPCRAFPFLVDVVACPEHASPRPALADEVPDPFGSGYGDGRGIGGLAVGLVDPTVPGPTSPWGPLATRDDRTRCYLGICSSFAFAPRSSATVDTQAVLHSLASMRSDLERCYVATRPQAAISHRLEGRLRVDERGRVTAVRVDGFLFPSLHAVGCVHDVIGAWTFPATRTAGTAVVRFATAFRPFQWPPDAESVRFTSQRWAGAIR